jgi:superfamily II DNA or RNA helicase
MDWYESKHPKGSTFIVVPTLALLDQWCVALHESGVAKEEIALFSGEEFSESPKRVNVFVLNTARGCARELASGQQVFLIVDECHRAATPANALALNLGQIASLGLSATPQREYDDGFSRYLLPLLGPVVFVYDYTSARTDEVIVPFQLVNIKIDLLPDEARQVERLNAAISRQARVTRGDTASEERLKVTLRRRAAVASSARMRLPVAARIVDQHRGRRTVVFHENIVDAEKLKAMIAGRDHRVTIYHSGIAPVLRRDNLRLFRKGIFDVLVCCRALDEGVDAPEIEIAVIASSTASTRQRIQRLGRALRPSAGKAIATIYTLYAIRSEEERLIREASRIGEIAAVNWKQSKRV